MKRTYNIFFALLLLPLSLLAAKGQAPVVQPQFWWAGMHNPSLQVLIHAQGVGQSDVTLSTTNVSTIALCAPKMQTISYSISTRLKPKLNDLTLC